MKIQQLRKQNIVLLLLVTGILSALLIFSVSAQSESDTESLSYPFVSHLAAGMPEQDVFFEADDGTIRRMTGTDPLAALNSELLAAPEVVEHDPFQLGDNPLAIFEEGTTGIPLGFTLGEWLAGTGTATYTVEGDTATLSISVRNLVPNGTYTMWCSRINFPPNALITDAACGAEDGSQNAFQTDLYGNADYTLEMTPLPEATAESINAVALAYHSDGNTYGSIPGDFGYNSHVHVVAFMPPVE